MPSRNEKELQTAQRPAFEKLVIFWSPNMGMKIGAESIKPERRNPATGQILGQSGIIEFESGIYRTSDPAEIALIRECSSYKIGKIREISEKEAASLMHSGPTRVQNMETSQTHDPQRL